MRKIEYIAVHCTATQPNTAIKAIQDYWKNHLGWKNPGYHYVIKADGEIVNLLPITEVSNGVKGYNHNTINISYIGGVDNDNKPKDTRTPEQKKTLLLLLSQLKKEFPNATIQGHRDFPGVKKACPSFDAKKEYIHL